jgi:glyoxylase I family protein
MRDWHEDIIMSYCHKTQPSTNSFRRPTAFAPFKETSDYFGDAQKVWMVNFRVRDLDKMAAQLQASGIAVKIDPQSYPYGRFARLHDPEGNPIELWQPKVPDTKG